MIISMIVAMDLTNAIGEGKTIPWRLSTDMMRFKNLTQGSGNNAVVMGRKTWESLPNKARPLQGRLNIVMSRNSKWKDFGAEVALYPGRAIEIAYSEACDICWIIGGSEIYDLFIDLVDEIHLTRVQTEHSGQVVFPRWESDKWTEKVVEECVRDSKNEFGTIYSIWKKN